MSLQQASFSFSLKFANELVKLSPESDVCFSPASISLVFAMCYWGSDGNTKEEMRNVFFKGLDDEQILSQTSAMIGGASDTKADTDRFKLTYADRIYLSNQFTLQSAFVEKNQQSYRADVKVADFGQADQTAQEINQWVDSVTHERNKDLVSPEIFTTDAVAVLISALYFKSDWANQFDAFVTNKQDFHSSPEQTRKIDMMTQMGSSIKYTETEEAQLIQLPYVNKKTFMLFILPKEKFGLSSLLGSLSDEKLSNLIQEMSDQEVNVKIPRFKIEARYELIPLLEAIGLNDVFDATNAVLTGIVEPVDDSKQKIFIAQAVHKTFIEVGENGTEASAATISQVFPMFPRDTRPPKEFIADHPFMFAILHGEAADRHVLFFGQFYNRAN